jgi:hypothetical protein
VAHEPNNTDCKSPMTFMQWLRKKQTPHSFHALRLSLQLGLLPHELSLNMSHKYRITHGFLVSWDHKSTPMLHTLTPFVLGQYDF